MLFAAEATIQNESFGIYGLGTLDPRQVELRLRFRI